MAISEADGKLLWGRAAGICSNTSCRTDLTAILQESNSYNVGEMAHIIARSEDGQRGEDGGGGSDKYPNLILLCPTCHRHIDKSPEGTFTVEQLHRWKSDHEHAIRLRMSEVVYKSIDELKGAVSKLLMENHFIWEECGPQSKVAKEDPGSNSYKICMSSWDSLLNSPNGAGSVRRTAQQIHRGRVPTSAWQDFRG